MLEPLLGVATDVVQSVANEVAPGVVRSVDIDAVVQRVDVQGLVDKIDIEAVVDRIDLERLVGKVDVQALVDRIDLQDVLTRIDVQQVLARINPDDLIARVDLDDAVARIDVNRVLARIDINAVLAGADVQALVERIDLDAFLVRVDLNDLLSKVDVNELLKRVDIDDLIERTEVGSLIARSGTAVIAHILETVRGVCIFLDATVNRIVDRLLRRDSSNRPNGPPALAEDAGDNELRRGTSVTPRTTASVHGQYAGIVTRFAGFLIDAVTIVFLFSACGGLLEYLLGMLLGHPVAFSENSRAAAVAFGVWVVLALTVPVVAGGRTVGMGVVGLRAVRADGRALRGGRAVARTLFLVLSFALLCLGFVFIVLRRDRRALHDLLAGSAVVYATRPPGVHAGVLVRH